MNNKKDQETVIMINPEGLATVIDDYKRTNILEELPAKIYEVHNRDIGISKIFSLQIKKNLKLPVSHALTRKFVFSLSDVLPYFTEKKKRVDKLLNIMTKVNYLVEGTAGSGKTTATLSLMKELCEKHDWRGFIVKSKQELLFVKAMVEATRKAKHYNAIIMFDECEPFLYQYSSEMKTLLDGNESIPDSCFIGITNHLSKIPKSFYKNRPSRIKRVISANDLDKELAIELYTKLFRLLPEELKIEDMNTGCRYFDNSKKESFSLDTVCGKLNSEIYRQLADFEEPEFSDQEVAVDIVHYEEEED